MPGKEIEVQPTDGTKNGQIQRSVTPFEKFWAKQGNQVFFERTAERLGVTQADLHEIFAQDNQENHSENPTDNRESPKKVRKRGVQDPMPSEPQGTPQEDVTVFAIDYGSDISIGKRRSRKKP